MRRIVLVVSVTTLVAVSVTVVTALGFVPAVPWLVSSGATATLLAALSLLSMLAGARVNRIIGVLGLAIALGYVVVIGIAARSVDPVLAGGYVAIPYLAMQGLMPLCAAACGIWGLCLGLRRVPQD
jgi:hypothetical protein